MPRPAELESNGTLTVETGVDLKRALAKIARAEDRSLSKHVAHVLADYVRTYKESQKKHKDS